MSRTEKREHWSAEIVRWQASGLSQAEFCRTNGVALWQFRYWLGRERRRSTTEQGGGFVQVQAASDRGSGLSLRFPSGMELVIGSGFDAVTLRQVLSGLAGFPC